MDDFRDWPALLTAPQRNNFFFGKMMGVAQFEREQRYGMGQRWLLNRLTIGTGVLCGLEVTLAAEGKSLRVAPGVAIDPWGREIVVAHSQPYDPFATGGGCSCGGGDSTPITEAGDYMLCLTYRECTTNDQHVQYADDCPDQPDCQPDTTVETFGLRLSPAETPKAFDCAAWTRPGTPAGDGEAAPPTIADLCARLVELFGNSCAPPSATCVPLALVTASKIEDRWSLSVSAGPRRRIYTQAQMLETILCLAKCCGSSGHEEPVGDTLQITGIQFLRITESGAPVANFPRRLEVVSPRQPGAYPPVFDVRPSFTGGAAAGPSDPIALRISFNKAIEGGTVTLLPLLPSQPLGYALMVAPLDTPAAEEVETRATFSLLEDANSVLLICPGAAGAYRIIVRGDPVSAPPEDTGPGLPAVTTWDPDPTKRRRLDGEVARPPQFPSGNNTDGGNFEYSYELRPAEVVDPFRAERILFQRGDAEEEIELKTTTGTTIPTDSGIDSIRIVFNAPVDLDSVRDGLTIRSDGDAVPSEIAADPNDNIAIVRVRREAGNENPNPFPPGNYEVTLSASVIKDAPAPGAPRFLSGKPKSDAEALPTRGDPGADDFVFSFQVNAP